MIVRLHVYSMTLTLSDLSVEKQPLSLLEIFQQIWVLGRTNIVYNYTRYI